MSWTRSGEEVSLVGRVALARSDVQRLQRLVAERKEGASALAAAQYRLELALRDLRRSKPFIADDDGPEAA